METKSSAARTITFRLQRYDPEKDSAPRWQTRTLAVPEGLTVLEALHAVKPYLIPAQGGGPVEGEYLQTPAEREFYGQFSICIKCGLCMSACPTMATDPYFLGPQPMAQAYRYTVDCRDAGLAQRLEALDAMHGPYQCHLAGACTDACPKGVDPALGIQLLKRTLCLEALGLRGRKSAPRIAPLSSEYVSKDKIPKPPPRTVTPKSGPA